MIWVILKKMNLLCFPQSIWIKLSCGSIPPDRIALPAQFQRQLFFHFQRFFACIHGFDMAIQTGSEESTIFLNDAGRQIMALLIAVSGTVLFKTSPGVFAGHPDIEAFEDTIVLRVG